MRKSIAILIFFSAALLVAGCGDYPRSTVRGKITYNGKPVADATIIFLTRDNMTYTAGTKADGSYEVGNIPRGTVTVSIQQALPHIAPRPDPTPMGKAGGAGTGESKDQAARNAPPPSEPVALKSPIPSKYMDAKQSGLQFELKDPEQEWSVDLK